MDASTQPISPLRCRCIDDMTVRKLDPEPQAHYIRAVNCFADFLGCSPAGASAEDLRRFLLHVLPRGFHRIRHYGLLANTQRQSYLSRARELLAVPPAVATTAPTTAVDDTPAPARATFVCSVCGAPMGIIDTLAPAPPAAGPTAHPQRAISRRTLTAPADRSQARLLRAPNPEVRYCGATPR